MNYKLPCKFCSFFPIPLPSPCHPFLLLPLVLPMILLLLILILHTMFVEKSRSYPRLVVSHCLAIALPIAYDYAYCLALCFYCKYCSFLNIKKEGADFSSVPVVLFYMQ